MLYSTAQSWYLHVRLLPKVACLSFSNISPVTDSIKYYFPLQTDKIACLFLKEEPTAYSRFYRWCMNKKLIHALLERISCRKGEEDRENRTYSEWKSSCSKKKKKSETAVLYGLWIIHNYDMYWTYFNLWWCIKLGLYWYWYGNCFNIPVVPKVNSLTYEISETLLCNGEAWEYLQQYLLQCLMD